MNADQHVTFDEIPALLGSSYVGEPFSITRRERDAFEDVTWIKKAYTQPDDPSFAEDTVEGFHSLALLDAISMMANPFDSQTIVGYNYGLDRVRFTAPLLIGDQVTSRFEVREIRSRGEGYLVLRHCELRNQRTGRLALVADWWIYLRPVSQTDHVVTPNVRRP